jgi:hypothetical protein
MQREKPCSRSRVARVPQLAVSSRAFRVIHCTEVLGKHTMRPKTSPATAITSVTKEVITAIVPDRIEAQWRALPLRTDA